LQIIIGIITEFWEWDDAETDAAGFFNYYSIYFANGGDREVDNVPEVEVCKDTGVEMLWGVGGGKIQSSSDLIKNYEGSIRDESNWNLDTGGEG